MTHPPLLLLLTMSGGIAKAVVTQIVHQIHNSLNHSSDGGANIHRALSRTLTHEELEPLENPIKNSAILSPHCVEESPEEPSRSLSQKRSSRALSAITNVMGSTSFSIISKLVVEAAAILLAIFQRQWSILALLVLIEAMLVTDYLRTRSTVHQGQEPESAVESGTPPLVAVIHPSTPPQFQAEPLISGSWHKVDALSDSQDPAADILKLSGLARTATRLFKGMQFIIKDGRISMKALTKVPFLKVSEEVYALDGSISMYNRRDLRKGQFRGYVQTQSDGGINLYYKWEEPLSGYCCDEIKVQGKDELQITTHLTVGDSSCAYRVIYHRAGTQGTSRTASSPSIQQQGVPTPEISVGKDAATVYDATDSCSTSETAYPDVKRTSLSSDTNSHRRRSLSEDPGNALYGTDFERRSDRTRQRKFNRRSLEASPFARVANM